MENSEFSVHYLFVGHGDCTLVRFPDGKNLVIDSGCPTKTASRYVESCVKTAGGKIDYFVVSHPGVRHSGNAVTLAEKFEIYKAFVPYISNADNFPAYGEVVDTLNKRGAKTAVSSTDCVLEGENYYAAILWPTPVGETDCSYDALNAMEILTEEAVDDISCVIYLEYEGVRFLFTSDLGATAEEVVKRYHETGVYDKIFGAGKIKLENIDFYKAAKHGSSASNSEAFLEILKPANAVVSVGNENSSALPSSAMLRRILSVNHAAAIYRTDVHGTVSVKVARGGSYIVETESV